MAKSISTLFFLLVASLFTASCFAAIVEPTAIPVPDTMESPEPTPEESPMPTDEGCVAIEHLEGYVLQHPVHLMKPVLCAHDFCATPNHAIIVDGEMTSMKRLCATKWECTKTVKLVNNLRITANRRAVVSDRITVTPYDLRVPKIVIWVVQIAEQLFSLLSMPAIFALCLAGMGVFKTEKSKLL